MPGCSQGTGSCREWEAGGGIWVPLSSIPSCLCAGEGGWPHPSSGPRGARIPLHNPCFLPSCESHRPVQEPLHLKGRPALKSAAWGGRGGSHLAGISLLEGSQPTTCTSPCRGERCCQRVVRHTAQPVPPALCPHRGLGAAGPSLCAGMGGSPKGQLRDTRAPWTHADPKGPLPLREAAGSRSDLSLKREPHKGTKWHHGLFFFFIVNLLLGLILKKIGNDFAGSRSLAYSCQRAEVRKWTLGLLQTLWHDKSPQARPLL